MIRILLIAVLLSFGCGLVYGCGEAEQPAEEYSSLDWIRLDQESGLLPTIGPGECKMVWVPQADGLSECLFKLSNGERIELKLFECRDLARRIEI